MDREKRDEGLFRGTGSPRFIHSIRGIEVNARRSWLLDTRLLFLGGILLGIGLGLIAGWLIWPVTYYDTDLYDLHPEYQDELVVMVGALNALEGDLGLARQLLAQVSSTGVPRSPEAIVVDVTERYIARGAAPQDIDYLVRLARALNAVTTPMQPFLADPGP